MLKSLYSRRETFKKIELVTLKSYADYPPALDGDQELKKRTRRMGGDAASIPSPADDVTEAWGARFSSRGQNLDCVRLEAMAERQSPTGHAGQTDDHDEAADSEVSIPKDDSDATSRRIIRHQYRELINSVQQNREDMLNPNNNKLTEALEEANKLFSNVRQAREAALDSQFLVLATNLGKEKASQLQADAMVFDASAFAESLLTFMGLNRLEEDDSEEEAEEFGGYLPRDAWHRLAKKAARCFRTAPTFHYMYGSYDPGPPVPRQRVERKQKAPNKEERRIMPVQLKKMEESHQEATEKEVERILGILLELNEAEPNNPLSYFDFVIDPHSFAHTVENMFHVSFLVRDGHARIYLDKDKMPVIEPVMGGSENEGPQERIQCVISLTQREWRDIVETFEITDATIKRPAEASS
ncbi:non-structural maintenance of chromosomes element 4 homolog A [Polypterus senegalus]|uniref:non-structural maintenance of chromosomes element 4 homolog A n=1 Tax=Polypterus senegalus TaxID=55291 RepID=UPI001963CD5E|nr:non-structural maintenance of chromosomes element 4 homolog A [Polypterus senegalus]